MEEGVLPVAILKKVRDGWINLDGYWMNEKMAMALGDSLKYLDQTVHSVRMNNNDMGDQAIASILLGL